jgi:hypothetical protein
LSVSPSLAWLKLGIIPSPFVEEWLLSAAASEGERVVVRCFFEMAVV